MARTVTTPSPALPHSAEAPRRGRKRKETAAQPAPSMPLLDLSHERALTVEQTAEYLGVGRPKVYDYLRDGLPSVKLSDGVRRVMLSSLITWLKERETRGVV